MKIKAIEIYGYGKWIDQKFEISDHLHIFLGQNEAGKSTLMSFIHSILFGFPTRNSTLLRYEPRESSRYGGNVELFDSRFGKVKIERIHGKVTGDVTVTLEDGTIGSDKLLETILNGMDRTMFQNIFSFSLSDIEHVHQLNKNELSRYLYNIGAQGTEYYLDLADSFQKEANRIYRPSGKVRPLNKELQKLEEKEEKLTKIEAKNADYLKLVNNLNELNEKVKKIEQEKRTLEERLASIREIKKEWHLFEEIKELDREIQKIQLPPLKKDGPLLLKEYQNNLFELENKIEKNHLELYKQKENLGTSINLNEYLNQKDKIQSLEQNLPELVEDLNHYQRLQENLEESDNQIKQFKKELLHEGQDNLPTPFSIGEIETSQIWQQEILKEEEKIQKINHEMFEIKHELDLLNQKLDQIETMLWEKNELEQVKQELKASKLKKETNRQDTTSTSLKKYLFIVFAFISLLMSYFINVPFRWGSIFLSVLFFFLFVKEKFKKTKHSDVLEESTENISFLKEQYEKQVDLYDKWEKSLNKIDQLQFIYEEKKNKIKEHTSLQKSYENNWKNLLLNHLLSENIPINQSMSMIEKVNQLTKIHTKKLETLERVKRLEKELMNKTKEIPKILNVKEENIESRIAKFRQYTIEMKNELHKKEKEIDELQIQEQNLKQFKENKKELLGKIDDLLASAEVETIESFNEIYKQKEIYDRKVSRLQFLKENVPEKDIDENLTSEKEILKLEDQLVEKVNKNDQMNKEFLNQRATVEISIKDIEQDGTYTEELQKFENLKTSTQDLVDEWIANKLASNLIKTTLGKVTEEKFGNIIQDASDYFCVLTNNLYDKIQFNEEKLFVQNKKQQIIDVRGLSRGTAEPLYVALRLAYIKNTKDTMEFPLIMDDPFVNFDTGRRKKMYQLLEQLSDDLQIIYFTFDDEVNDLIYQKELTIL